MENQQTPAEQPVTACSAGPAVLDVDAIRKQFPIFASKAGTIFFDNAATTQKPQAVIDTITDFYRLSCANAGRASYSMSTSLTAAVERARQRVALFLNAAPEEIVFTSGATESLNLVALSWGLHNLKSGDEVMVCYEDHKSTVLPWLNLQKTLRHFGVEIKIVAINIHPEGDYELKSIREAKTDKTRLLAMTHVHHLYGLDMEVSEVRKIVGPDVLISLDASQSVGHRKVDVKHLEADFVSFSGHKMFAANGVGVLWANARVHAGLQPVIVGGGMTANTDSGAFDLPRTTLSSWLEGGTQNIPAILSLVPALDFIEGVGMDNIDARLSALTRKLYHALKGLNGIEFSPGVDRCGCHRGFGIVSFCFSQVSTSDLSFLLESEGILVRTGDHCVTKQLGVQDYVRVSMHVYNTDAEIDRLIDVLKQHLT